MSASHQGQAFLTSAAFLAPASARSFVLVKGAPGVEEWTKRYREALAEEAGVLSSDYSLHQLQSHIRAVESDIAKRRQNEVKIFSECMSLAELQPSGAPNASPATSPDIRDVNLALRLAEAAKSTLSGELLASQMRIREAETNLARLRNENGRVERACRLCDVHLVSLVVRSAGGAPGKYTANRTQNGEKHEERHDDEPEVGTDGGDKVVGEGEGKDTEEGEREEEREED